MLVTIPASVRKSPITITVPRPIPYASNKAIPSHYDGECYQQGQKLDTQKSEKGQIEEEESEVHNIIGESIITRSGRILSPPRQLKSSTGATTKIRGKQIVVNGGKPGKIHLFLFLMMKWLKM